MRKKLQLNKKLNNIINYRVYSIFITQISDKHKTEIFVHYTFHIIIIQKIVQIIQQGHRENTREDTTNRISIWDIWCVPHVTINRL